jgi:hypothetical protein
MNHVAVDEDPPGMACQACGSRPAATSREIAIHHDLVHVAVCPKCAALPPSSLAFDYLENVRDGFLPGRDPFSPWDSLSPFSRGHR